MQVHVFPFNDLVEHDVESYECVCGPRLDPVEAEDGTLNWIVVHHSLDGRERFE